MRLASVPDVVRSPQAQTPPQTQLVTIYRRKTMTNTTTQEWNRPKGIRASLRKIRPSIRDWATNAHVDADLYVNGLYLCKYTYNPAFSRGKNLREKREHEIDDALFCIYQDASSAEIGTDYGLEFGLEKEAAEKVRKSCEKVLDKLNRLGIWDSFRDYYMNEETCY
jgi:hypothetical protein